MVFKTSKSFKKRHRKKNFDYEAQLLNDTVQRKIIPTAFYLSLATISDKTKTIWDLLKISAEINAERNFIGRRKLNDKGELGDFVWRNYQQTFDRINLFSNGITQLLGFSPPNDKTGDEDRDYLNDTNISVGIYSINRPEWLETSLAVQSVRFKAVPLYDTFGFEALLFILSQTELSTVVCSKDKVEILIKAKKNGAEKLKIIIQMDDNPLYNNTNDKIDNDLVKKAEECGLKLIAFSEILKNGEQNIKEFNPERPTENDLALIMYTSGTSGTPKGVLLTHGNAINSVKNSPREANLSANGRFLSYLPLAHIFEALVELLLIAGGCSIGYYSGHIKYLTDDIKLLRPEYFTAVPRVLDKIYSKIISTAQDASFIKRYLFNMSLQKGIDATHTPEGLISPKFFDSIVWSKIREKMGFENLQLLVTGGAPCPPRLIEFFRVLTRAQIIQGYGLTESFAVATLTQPDDVNLGHAGLSNGGEIRLKAVDGTDYSPKSNPPTGEITFKGKSVFKGYFKDPERTKEVLIDGWLHTGDVGRLNPNGTYSVIDRKKSIFKLSHGEYVSPEVLESIYGQSRAVSQLWTYGDSHHSYVIAVAVPEVNWAIKKLNEYCGVDKKEEIDELKRFLEENALEKFAKRFKEIAEPFKVKLREDMLSDFGNYEDDLKGFEKIKELRLEIEIDSTLNGFNISNECLTPSFKLRRHFLKKRYQSCIDEMYVGGNEK